MGWTITRWLRPDTVEAGGWSGLSSVCVPVDHLLVRERLGVGRWGRREQLARRRESSPVEPRLLLLSQCYSSCSPLPLLFIPLSLPL